MMYKSRVAAALALAEFASATNMKVSPRYFYSKKLIVHDNIVASSNYGSNRSLVN